MRTMFDSVNPTNIPVPATMIGAYVDGAVSKWPSGAIAAARKHATVVTITTTGDNVANVADYEKGNLNLAKLIEWVKRMRSYGGEPAVYCSRATMPRVTWAFSNVNLAFPLWWIADWTGVKHMFPGSIATQWSNGLKYDTSLVANYWPGVDQPPLGQRPVYPYVLPSRMAPDKPRQSKAGDAMAFLCKDSNGPTWYVVADDLSSKTKLALPSDLNALEATGRYATIILSQGTLQWIPTVG